MRATSVQYDNGRLPHVTLARTEYETSPSFCQPNTEHSNLIALVAVAGTAILLGTVLLSSTTASADRVA